MILHVLKVELKGSVEELDVDVRGRGEPEFTHPVVPWPQPVKTKSVCSCTALLFRTKNLPGSPQQNFPQILWL